MQSTFQSLETKTRYLLRQLDEIKAEQKAAARKPRPAKGKAKPDQLALPSPPLQLSYFPGEE
ncbi:hypothetical protein IFT84_11610 [Rhizobium sp. CFBP 8762]|uniref:hypothetical protein n=1 Tax=Rhizobium sp. CFBP 8762 TaxID=2775279 RepID=UPI00177C7233|nr:hypothetical protein [Rhizobium sp. CFBP 8762]MBD8555164.1 hypothetical protein [Rhizobium sp. CFBP 8762]